MSQLLTLAVIGTFYRRYENTEPLLRRVLHESTRPPAELWVMCEGQPDLNVAVEAYRPTMNTAVNFVHLPTPRNGLGRCTIIPYSNKINYALARTKADAVVYLDNASMPSPDKFELMLRSMEDGAGAVYCSQTRLGHDNTVFQADAPIKDAYCVLNYTQVMHRPTEDRWELDMQYAEPDIADARFWRKLHERLGAFQPVKSDEPLDTHHIASASAEGLVLPKGVL